MKVLLAAAFFILLTLCSGIDIRKRIIPNALVAVVCVLGLVKSALYHSLYPALLGILLPSLPLLLVKSKITYLGAGDIKLLSAIGAWVGWFLNLAVFVLACSAALIFAVVCSIFAKRIRSVPFAPFLSISALSLYIVSWAFP